jgi:hypothetical protein
LPDIILLNATGTHQIFVNDGLGGFDLHPQQFSSPSPTGYSIGDYNNDGRPDLALTSAIGTSIFLNDGSGNLGPGDTSAPILSLTGQADVTVIVEETYSDAGATAMDSADGNISDRVVATNPVNTSVIGTYTVTYNVTDRSGNKAAPVTRIVRVETRQASGGGGGGALDWLTLWVLLLATSAAAWRPRSAYSRPKFRPVGPR